MVDQRATLDFDMLEKHASDPACGLMILCNPMNPNGSVLSNEELTLIGAICDKHNVVLCSDEIHCDLIIDPSERHIPAGKVEALEGRSITLMAASKTFNIAGLGTSFAVIPNARLRNRFVQATQGLVPWANILGLVATELAFTQCHEWHQALLKHLKSNRDLLASEINKIDGLSYLPAPATFLAWIDASGLDYSDPQVWFENKGVGPSPGRDFGAPQYARINFASSRSYLNRLIDRLKA